MDVIHYCAEKTNALLQFLEVKVATSILLSGMTFFFGEIYTQGLIAIVMLMVFDTILGIAADKHENKVISSRRFSRAVIKGIVYFTAISAAYFTDLTVPGGFVQSTMIAFVAMTEFISILENVGRLGFKTPQKLLNQLRDINNNR